MYTGMLQLVIAALLYVVVSGVIRCITSALRRERATRAAEDTCSTSSTSGSAG